MPAFSENSCFLPIILQQEFSGKKPPENRRGGIDGQREKRQAPAMASAILCGNAD
jgi:hypothetical protein